MFEDNGTLEREAKMTVCGRTPSPEEGWWIVRGARVEIYTWFTGHTSVYVSGITHDL